jgi:hypothetical protein
VPAARAGEQTDGMNLPQERSRRLGPGELVLTVALLSMYVGCRGTSRVLGAVEAIVPGTPAPRPRRW